MKQTIYILALLFTTTVFGQTKDRRAELGIQGRVQEISVSPDEKIWLVTAIGNIYYTDNIDSNWHYGNPVFEKDEDDYFTFNAPNLDRISFFNKDTAILTGYISGNKKEYRKSGYYLTKDAGKTWKLLDFCGDSWIYNTFIDKKGNAWMGGSSGEIFFSDNYGQHWKKLNSPYNSSSRMHSIFMIDETDGISGALHNDIYVTSNNWKSSKKVKTPLDQKKYTSDRGDDRIEKILLWNNFIVVNQNGHIYYTNAEKIDWQSFPIKIYDFELDKEANLLFAITDSLKVITLSSPTEMELLTDQCLLSFPLDLKIVNHSLFIVSNDYDVYRVNKNGLTHVILYTTNKKIEEPRIVKEGKNLIWGINGKQIYLADDNNRDWYRENVLDFYVSDFMLLSDSIAILWDGIKDNYLYSLKDHIPQKYFPEFPLKKFLDSSLKSFSINSGTQGCFHYENNKVNYERTKDSVFATKSFSVGEKKSSFKNKVNENRLVSTLITINSNPSAVPLLKDFQITEEDKQNYLALIDTRLQSKDYDFSTWKKKFNKNFYYSVPSMLDTLDNSIIQCVLNQVENGWSTTSNWFTIQIVNENNDTINISRNYYMSTLPWNLPWKFEYQGLHFNCYSIEFSRFINSCIPDNFMDKKVFDNSILIMEIADYLWNREE
jgi:hypothetical protein